MRNASRSAQLSVVVVVVIALVLGTASSPSARAQNPRNSTPKIGEHVRIHMTDADSSLLVGRLRALYSDSLAIVPDSDHWEVSLTRADIARLEVERHEKTREYAATWMGLVGGLTGGGIAIANCLKDREACASQLEKQHEAECRGDPYVNVGELLFVGGALAGGLLGYALAPAPHWDMVMLPTSTTGFDGQQHLGLAFGVRYSPSKRRR